MTNKLKYIYKKILSIINNLYLNSIIKSSSDYWEYRYKKGYDSGRGSYGKFSDIKSENINNFISKYNIKDVIEFGCGDGNQLINIKYENYIGYDVSKTIIDIVKEKFKHKQKWKFDLMENYDSKKATLTVSLDVIYHLVEDKIFEQYIETLFNASLKYVIIHSRDVDENNSELVSTGFKSISFKHFLDRKFSVYIEKNISTHKLIEKIETLENAYFFIYKKL